MNISPITLSPTLRITISLSFWRKVPRHRFPRGTVCQTVLLLVGRFGKPSWDRKANRLGRNAIPSYKDLETDAPVLIGLRPGHLRVP